MKYTINDNCIACCNCLVVCKNGAIDMGLNRLGVPFLINNNCINCGECQDVCWIGAIKGS